MTDPQATPFTDAELDRLLAHHPVEPAAPDLVDRIVAEARRPGRPRTALPPMPARRSPRRHWARRRLAVMFVVVNLIAASAIAAAFGGGVVTFAKLAQLSAHVLALAKAELPRALYGRSHPHVPGTHVVVHRASGPHPASGPPPRPPLAASVMRTPPAMTQRAPFRPIHPRAVVVTAAPVHHPRLAGPHPVRRQDHRTLHHRSLPDVHRPHAQAGAAHHERVARDGPRQAGPPRRAAVPVGDNGRTVRQPPLRQAEARPMADRAREGPDQLGHPAELGREERAGGQRGEGWRERRGWRQRGDGRTPRLHGGARRWRRWF